MARPSPGPATSLEILSSSAILRAAPWADVERLAQRSTVRRYRRGSVILARGTVWDSLLVVGRGLGKATAISPGDEAGLVLSILRPGDIFGENSLFNRMPVPLSLIAISESDVALVPHADVITLMERRPAIAIAIASSLCEKMRFAVQMTVALRFLDASSRLHQRLQLLSGFDSWRVGAAIRIQHGLTQQELA